MNHRCDWITIERGFISDRRLRVILAFSILHPNSCFSGSGGILNIHLQIPADAHTVNQRGRSLDRIGADSFISVGPPVRYNVIAAELLTYLFDVFLVLWVEEGLLIDRLRALTLSLLKTSVRLEDQKTNSTFWQFQLYFLQHNYSGGERFNLILNVVPNPDT